MFRGHHNKAILGLIGASAVALVVSSTAYADDASSGLAAPGAAIAGASLPQPLAAASGPRPNSGIPFEGWMLYPSLFVGAIFDDNIYRTETGRYAAAGVRVTPNFEADLDNGIYKTTVYGTLDAQIYPGNNSNLGETASTYSGRAGFAQLWSPTKDIVAHFNADFTRQDGAFGSALVTGSPINSATSFVGAPVALNVVGFRQFTDQTTGSLSVEKTITDKTFVRVGIGALDLVYERAPTGITSALDGADYSAFVRGGLWVTPQVNGFVEVDGDLRRYYASSAFDTNGYRVVIGLASDMIGLFRGEIYGGLQQQFSTRAAFGIATAPSYGARLTYYPTQYLTVAASVDNIFSAAGAFGPSGTVSTNNVTLQSRLQADYAMFEQWKASGRAAYAETQYSGTGLSAASWLVGGGVSYAFLRNFSLTLDYQFTRTISNGFGAGLTYSDNLVSAGATYHY